MGTGGFNAVEGGEPCDGLAVPSRRGKNTPISLMLQKPEYALVVWATWPDADFYLLT